MSTSPPPPLAQDDRGRPRDFGLDVKRLRLVRLIVFAVLALPVLLLALLTVRFVSMPITQATHQSAYQDGDYPGAIERLAPVQVVNWFEPYLPHLSEGTDLLQMGEDAAAEAELRTALDTWNNGSDLNQPLHAQCKIINNLAISIERQADELDDPAERAERLYEAEVLMQPCAGGGGGGEGDGEGGEGEESEGEGEGEGEGEDGEEEEGEGGGEGEEEQESSEEGSGNEDSETTEENDERIRDKRREADEDAGNDPDERETEQGQGDGDGDQEGGSPRDPGDPRREDPEGDGPDEEAPTQGESENQEKEDELEQRNRDAQGGDGEDDSDGSPQDPSQPW